MLAATVPHSCSLAVLIVNVTLIPRAGVASTRVNVNGTLTQGCAPEIHSPAVIAWTRSGVWLHSGEPVIEPLSHGENVMFVPMICDPDGLGFDVWFGPLMWFHQLHVR